MASRWTKIGIASAAAAAAALVFLSLDLRPDQKSGKVHVVHIQGMLFQPATLQIERGDSVTWTNDDILLHAIKSSDGQRPWQSKDLKPHDSWTKVFSQGGVQAYLCPYHPTMLGKITIEEVARNAR